MRGEGYLDEILLPLRLSESRFVGLLMGLLIKPSGPSIFHSNHSNMSKRPNSDKPTTAKRARKDSGFRLARSVFTDPVQSTSGSSRFVTLRENPCKRGSLRAQNRLLPLPSSSEPSKSQSNGAESQASEPDRPDLQDAAQHEEVLPLTSHTEQGEKKRKRHNKTHVSDYSNIFLSRLS